MYQTSIARFMFMTIFRSLTFILSALAVYYIKHLMEKREYERQKTMVSSTSRWWLKK